MALADLRLQALRRTPAEKLAHLQNFELDLKFTAGIWFFSPMESRFHAKYKPDLSFEQRFELAVELVPYGLHGLEAHYPNEINEDNVHMWQKMEADTGLKLVTVIPLLFYDAEFEFGSLSSPIKSARDMAVERLKGALRMNKELDTEFAVLWPGIDGFENPFGLDFPELRKRFADGIVEAMDAVPGVRIAFEPKPYEPRGHILYPTTPEGVLLAHAVESQLSSQENRKLLDDGHSLVCLNPEIGHALMGLEDLAYAYSWPLQEGRLAHTHWNSQPLGNYDQDLNVGVISPEQCESLMYALKMHGYEGMFGIDLNPERMPIQDALKISMDALRSANDRVNDIDHEQVMFAAENPDKARGWIEAYLVRARAPHPERLAPLPDLLPR